MEATSTAKKCSVCHSSNGGNLLGINACRACAVFFRRYSKKGDALKCRTGREDCKLDRDNLWACQKCRYNRIKRIIERQARKQGTAINTATSSHCTPESEIPSEPPGELRSMRVGPILQRYRTCYNELCRQRLLRDCEIAELTSIEVNGVVAVEATTVCNSPSMIKRAYGEMHEFLLAASDDYAIMREDYQSRLFVNFAKAFYFFECYYRSVKYYPDNPKREFVSFTRYIDFDNLGGFFFDVPNKTYKNDAIRIAEEQTDKDSAFWRPALTRLNLTEEEFIGIISYLLWDISRKPMPDELVKVAERNKTAVLHEMHTYYRSIGLKGYSARLGEIFVFLSLLENLIDSSSHVVDVFKLLDVIDEETYQLKMLTIE